MRIDIKHIEKLIGSGDRLVCLEGSPAAALEALSAYARTSARAIYCWHPSKGLRRVSAPHIAIPGTDTLRGALKHVQNTRHYGVYAFHGCAKELGDPTIASLLQSLASPPQPDRLILLLDGGIHLAPGLRRTPPPRRTARTATRA
ncbi:hypothetical protein HUS23_13585 [Ectothiorhodospiraceae bacterium 2226]|nr:hypothetical protein HUS23_13585 [Ectothiorhodospiraceae bacterium 2226]